MKKINMLVVLNEGSNFFQFEDLFFEKIHAELLSFGDLKGSLMIKRGEEILAQARINEYGTHAACACFFRIRKNLSK